MKTSDTEWEKEFRKQFAIKATPNNAEDSVKAVLLEKFWQQGVITDMIDFINTVISSRDTYWKERVREIRNLYGEPRCESLHHNHSDRHAFGTPCPVMTRIHKALDTLLDNLK